jgi:outer membrane protein OmpA-like peptidoglycan-associated protein
MYGWDLVNGKNEMMRLFSAVVVFFSFELSYAQLYPHKWSIVVHTGFSTYYGDLTPYNLQYDGVWKTLGHIYTFNPNYFEGPSWQLSLNRLINNTVSFQLGSSQITFNANDRFVKPDGTLWTESQNFSRGLNVKTEIRDYSAGFVFRTDDGKLLSHRSIFAPYLGVSALLIRFRSFADLRDEEGNFYNLSDPQVRQNGIYETPLQQLRTEGIDYDHLVPGARLDLGFRVRLSGQISLLLSTQWTLAFTDYLDDVSGTYPSSFPDQLTQRASDPTDRRFITSQRGDNQPYDVYFFHSIGLQWSFGTRKSLRRFPTAGGFAAPPAAQNKPSKFDPLIKKEEYLSTSDTNSIIRLEQQKLSIQSLEDRLDLLSQGFYILNARLQVKENESKQSELIKLSDQLSDSIGYLNDLLREVDLDTILPKQVKDSLSLFVFTRKNLHKQSLDSLNTYRKKLIAESDSLKMWLSDNGDLMDGLLSDRNLATQVGRKKNIAPDSPAFKPAVENKPQMSEVEEKSQSLESIARHTSNRLKDTAQLVVDEIELDDTSEAQPKNIHTQNRKSDQTAEIASPDKAAAYPPTYQTRRPVRAEPQSFRQRREIPASIKTAPATTSLRDRTPEVKFQSTEINAEPKSETKDKTTGSQTDTLFYARITTILNQQTEALKLLVSELKELQNSRRPSGNVLDGNSVSYDRTIPPIDSSLFGQKIPVPKFADFKSKTTFFFDKGKSLPDSADILMLRRIGRFLADSTESFILITGFADNTGSIAANLELIRSRMQNIRNILIEEGVNPVRIRMEVGGVVVRGRPKANSMDRRVDITFFW